MKRWGVGAIYSGEIPAKDLARMTAALNVYDAFSSYKSNSHQFAKWAEANPAAFKLVAGVREMKNA